MHLVRGWHLCRKENTISSCLISQIISFILSPNAYGCVYASKMLEIGPAIDLQKIPILAKKKNHLFRWSSFWNGKPARIHWKAAAPKTNHCLVRILVQRHNWAIFPRKWANRGSYSQWRLLSGHVERNFVHKNLRGGY